MYLVYIAGPPASGKSTLMAALTRGTERVLREDAGSVAYERLYRNGELIGAELGRRRSGFPGTDALKFNVMPDAKRWVQSHFYPLILGEGSRLTSMKFLDAAAEVGYEVNLIVLSARTSVLDERCEARGSTQRRSWRMGQATICLRLSGFAEAAGYKVHHLDAEKPVMELRAELLTLPALKILKEEGNDSVPAYF